jgi:hypothetical protein
MYPSVLPQLVEANTQLDLVPLPPGLVTDRQSMDVLFYDPLSASRNGDEAVQAVKYQRNSKGDGHENRRKPRRLLPAMWFCFG